MPRNPKIADMEIDLLIAKVSMPKLDLDPDPKPQDPKQA